MIIYRYDKDSRTGVDVLQMPDNYELQDGDYSSLPIGLTPFKVVNNQLVASTQDEHDQAESAWLKAHPEDVPPVTNTKPQPSPAQKANADLMAQMMKLMQAQNAQVEKQNKQNALIMKQLMAMRMKINGGK